MKKLEKQLFDAVVAGDIDKINYLAKVKGVDVNATDPQGICALMLATRINKAPIAELLLELGADADHEDYLGRDAMDYALKYDAEASLLVLINHEGDKCDDV